MLTFAIAMPMIIGAVGIAVDYSLANQTRSKMQAVADAAALSAAREFQMARADPAKISAVAKNFVRAELADVAVDTKIDPRALSVQVQLTRDVEPTISKVVWQGKIHLQVAATASMSGGMPLCLLALDQKAKGTVTLRKNARLTAPGCVVNSNSKNPSGLMSMDDAVLQAGVICSAGGKVKTKNSNYAPEPLTDCPILPDPLATRQGPTNFTCNHKGKIVEGGAVTLAPGVYCGGLVIRNAQVTLSPGIFIVKDGPLIVDGNAYLRGSNVALYMKGPGANLNFGVATTIDLTAPKDGPLTGILIFDDPTGASAPELSGKHPKVDKSPREHQILSDNARTLLGTIYMPKGRLIVDATRPIADKSAYTVLVVQQLDLYEGPNLVLNSDYNASNIPVPKGVGPYGGTVALTQ